MALLARVHDPADVKSLNLSEMPQLAGEIRQFLVEQVARTGGHLGPNLGVVELTLALHRVFDSPSDVLLWDTGHQAYVHKILTGRAERFASLRQSGGISGYPSRFESEHDVIANSHASTALSYADGIAKGFQLSGTLGRRHVVAIIGDGALTGGMAWEALNNIAGAGRQVIIVVNDNERSYSPTIGGLANHLNTLRATRTYERVLDWGRDVLGRTPLVGPPVFEALHGMKKGIKDVLAPQGMFEDLGIKYLGPVDGHSVADLEHALRTARGYPGPVIVHAITQKGRGYAPAENDLADHFHGVGIIDPDTGLPVASAGPTWTGVFAEELVAIGEARPDVVAITAAMLGPTGLGHFAERFPDRVFDVGIAEQHAVTSAAGLAFAGRHPVVALYATFLNRAFDQVLMDVALHRAGVTFVLDRAGVTGDDGASHNGMWDMSIMSIIPSLQLAAPRDAPTLRAALRTAVDVRDAPTVIRYPKGRLVEDIPAVDSVGGVDILLDDPHSRTLVVAVGAMAGVGVAAGHLLSELGLAVTVVAPTWVMPIPAGLLELARERRLVVVVEDNGRVGGVGSLLRLALADARIEVPVQELGLPQEFLEQGSRAEVLARSGLTPQGCAELVRGEIEDLDRRAG